MPRKRLHRSRRHIASLVVGLFIIAADTAAAEHEVLQRAPHYTELGFFDMHICNWPERPEYFKVLFATEHFDDIVAMDVLMPDGGLLVSLDPARFMSLRRSGRPERRVFMVDIDVPATATTGWYGIDVRTRDGRRVQGRDYVIMARLARVEGPVPADNAEDVPMPEALSWTPVPGAQYYQLFLRDAWTDELLFDSGLVNEPRARLPPGKLAPGGYYYWSVHARDTNEHVLLGDFHMGSMSEKFHFSVEQ